MNLLKTSTFMIMIGAIPCAMACSYVLADESTVNTQAPTSTDSKLDVNQTLKKIANDNMNEILKKNGIVETNLDLALKDPGDKGKMIGELLDNSPDLLLVIGIENRPKFGACLKINSNDQNASGKAIASTSMRSISVDWYNKGVALIQNYKLNELGIGWVIVTCGKNKLFINTKTKEGIVTDITERRVILRGMPPSASAL